jgi:hypothetical protein
VVSRGLLSKCSYSGLRNFVRTIGGAFGLVSSVVILSDTLWMNLIGESLMSGALLSELTFSLYDLDSLDLSHEQQTYILNVYILGL